jgi:hypothetical protein
MSAYQTAQVAKQKAKEAAIAQLLSNGEIDLEEAVVKIEKIKTPEKNITTTSGDVQFRTTVILKITDEKLIPTEYRVIDEKHLLEDLKRGLVVPGATTEEIQTPVNFR